MVHVEFDVHEHVHAGHTRLIHRHEAAVPIVNQELCTHCLSTSIVDAARPICCIGHHHTSLQSVARLFQGIPHAACEHEQPFGHLQSHGGRFECPYPSGGLGKLEVVVHGQRGSFVHLQLFFLHVLGPVSSGGATPLSVGLHHGVPFLLSLAASPTEAPGHGRGIHDLWLGWVWLQWGGGHLLVPIWGALTQRSPRGEGGGPRSQPPAKPAPGQRSLPFGAGRSPPLPQNDTWQPRGPRTGAAPRCPSTPPPLNFEVNKWKGREGRGQASPIRT
eukprot:scaffold47_cov334-Pavlova_lutheri.AAC.44